MESGCVVERTKHQLQVGLIPVRDLFDMVWISGLNHLISARESIRPIGHRAQSTDLYGER